MLSMEDFVLRYDLGDPYALHFFEVFFNKTKLWSSYLLRLLFLLQWQSCTNMCSKSVTNLVLLLLFSYSTLSKRTVVKSCFHLRLRDQIGPNLTYLKSGGSDFDEWHRSIQNWLTQNWSNKNQFIEWSSNVIFPTLIVFSNKLI